MSFTHLHVHTQYSLLDGACRIEELVLRAKQLGQTSLAITDHGAMYGVVDFFNICQKHGIKPIIGCEVYVAKRTRFDKVANLDDERYHLVLLCKNETGYRNLIKLVSKSWTEGFYTKPRVDKDLLAEHSEGLIALSACLAGEIPRRILNDDFEGAKSAALWYSSVFGKDNFYLEIQDHGIEGEKKVMTSLIELSEQTGIGLVATNDVHYVNRQDSIVQKVLICIQTNHTIDEDTGLDFGTDSFYLKSEEDMLERFPKQAVENTSLIAQRCNFSFTFGEIKLPNYEVPRGYETHFDYFKELCEKGFARIYGESAPSAYRERMEYEMGIIRQMGYVDYFLIVWDYVNFAKSKGIAVGPGRGSGAGSICAYIMGITAIDPMKYNLIFERFLNPERVSMPDFDIDFCYERRQEVIDYVVQKYGADHVSQIITFGTMAARGAIRDVGRVLGMPYSAVDKVAKLVPQVLKISLEQALQESAQLTELYNSDEKVRELIDTAKKIEGMPRNASTHAAGVVITDEPVDEYVPLASNDGVVVAQYTMTTLERLGLLKMDFLGLRTLTVIDDAVKMLKSKGVDIDISNIDIGDKEVYRMISKGNTEGVFQFESAGMRQMLMGLQPESLEDLIASISLYRPGPAKSIPTYTRNRHNPELIEYKTPKLKNILDVTYGCLVYQEQVMQVFRELAGYSYGRADLVRRAMSKKKVDVMNKERQFFVYGKKDENGEIECAGAVANGVEESVAQSIFDDMSTFSLYAFNKSHAAAYALVAYQTAYLKYHYPCEFMAGLLTSVLDNSNKVSEYISECARINIKVLPPNVNESLQGFAAVGGNIRFGLLAIKNLGKGFIKSIIEQRLSEGEFVSFYDFCKRLYGKDFNRRALESLIKCGALDGLGANRRQMLQSMGSVMSSLESEKRRNLDGQIGFFDIMEENSTTEEFELADVEEFSPEELYAMEKEVTGMYITGHPLTKYVPIGKKLGVSYISEILECTAQGSKLRDGDRVSVLCALSSVQLKTLKNSTTMAFVNAEDTTAGMELIVFANTLTQYGALLTEGSIVVVEGKISVKDDETPKLICSSVSRVPDNMSQVNGGKLYVRVPSEDSPVRESILALLRSNEGRTKVFFYYTDSGKYSDLKNPVCTTAMDESILSELQQSFGKDNVVWRLNQ